jgi:tetratricopeptide (TPR) repeat protein
MYPERRHIRRGNRDFRKEKMYDASAHYLEALQRDSLSLEAAFNLGDAQYSLGDYAAAEATFDALLKREGVEMTDEQRADVHYNLGTAQLQQQKLQEALESYKSAMMLNPSDQQAKFNYVVTKELQKQQQEQQQNQGGDQNQEGGQNQEGDQNGDNQPQQQPQENGEQPKDNEGENQPDESGPKDQPSPEGDGGQQPQQSPAGQTPKEMSRQMLDAVQRAEDQTREKVDSRRVIGVGASGKNW